MEDIFSLKKKNNYNNIYLFASGELDENVLKQLKIKEEDGIILFNKPCDKLKYLLKGREISYSFNRGYDGHLYKVNNNDTLKIIHDGYNISNCNFILMTDKISKNILNKINNYYFYDNLLLDGEKISNCIKEGGYIPDKPGHYSPSLGFLGVYIMKKLYPDAKLNLVGFTNIKKRIIRCHNYSYENEYISKLNNIKYI